MAFQKGVSGCPGGRTDPRKTRARIAITRVVEENAERISAWFADIEREDGPKAALDAFIKLAEYALPKLQRTEISGDFQSRIVEMSDAELDERIAGMLQGIAATGKG